MKEVLGSVHGAGIPFLVIGGHGLSVHNVHRDTVDLDCLVAAENRELITRWLIQHGFVQTATHPNFSRFRHQSLVYPLLDVMEVDAATYAKLSAGSCSGRLFGYDVKIPAVPHFIALKLHAIKQNPDREDKDRADIVSLVRANPGSVTVVELEALCQRYAPAGFWDTLKPKLPI